MIASGRKFLITSIDSSIDSFFSGIKRGTGSSRPSSGRTRPNSSERSRHPEWIRAAQSVDLPSPGEAGKRIAWPLRSTPAECSSSR
ncbi:MAG: hypothetical protein AW12_02764 [Candidatus Accumulibacter sp. BA-94]|nr:MAG: hypothetical protein AW12_02764 [Candidatus Accumulibacter sp. BA-94]